MQLQLCQIARMSVLHPLLQALTLPFPLPWAEFPNSLQRFNLATQPDFLIASPPKQAQNQHNGNEKEQTDSFRRTGRGIQNTLTCRIGGLGLVSGLHSGGTCVEDFTKGYTPSSKFSNLCCVTVVTQPCDLDQWAGRFSLICSFLRELT